MSHPTSLRRKITLGYAAIGVLIIGLSLLAFVELLRLERQTGESARISEFLNHILEMRRYEKNYFLYRKPEDLRENRRWREAAARLPERHGAAFAAVLPPPQRQALHQEFARYGQFMEACADADRRDDAGETEAALEEAARQSGKALATTAEHLAERDQALLRVALEGHRRLLLTAIAALALMAGLAGRILSRMVTQPLRAMESAMRRIAEGEIRRVEPPSRDQEILSVTQAINRMLGELQARQKDLVRSEKLAALGTMLSGVAHELNNPLSNIGASCQILLEEPETTPLQRELLEQIDEQTLRAAAIVRSLLDFARDRPSRRESAAVRPLLEETTRLLRPQIPAEVLLTFEAPDSLRVWADGQRLRQALLNLVRNGVDAVDGAGEVKLIARELAEPPEWEPGVEGGRLVVGWTDRLARSPAVEIAVRDSGCGIPPEALPRIFDPFYTTKPVGKGTGLGLFITHEMVEEHGGCLVVETRPGEGTIVRLLLPKEPS
ncbi:MAG: HAMP domain-containing protein [Magnetococcales bacterium]|nr:HAMP domain-containing protein [Magnetococcales bacterium]